MERKRNRDVSNDSRKGRVWKSTDETIELIDLVMGSEIVAAYFCFLNGLRQGYQWRVDLRESR